MKTDIQFSTKMQYTIMYWKQQIQKRNEETKEEIKKGRKWQFQKRTWPNLSLHIVEKRLANLTTLIAIYICGLFLKMIYSSKGLIWVAAKWKYRSWKERLAGYILSVTDNINCRVIWLMLILQYSYTVENCSLFYIVQICFQSVTYSLSTFSKPSSV